MSLRAYAQINPVSHTHADKHSHCALSKTHKHITHTVVFARSCSQALSLPSFLYPSVREEQREIRPHTPPYTLSHTHTHTHTHTHAQTVDTQGKAKSRALCLLVHNLLVNPMITLTKSNPTRAWPSDRFF